MDLASVFLRNISLLPAEMLWCCISIDWVILYRCLCLKNLCMRCSCNMPYHSSFQFVWNNYRAHKSKTLGCVYYCLSSVLLESWDVSTVNHVKWFPTSCRPLKCCFFLSFFLAFLMSSSYAYQNRLWMMNQAEKVHSYKSHLVLADTLHQVVSFRVQSALIILGTTSYCQFSSQSSLVHCTHTAQTTLAHYIINKGGYRNLAK